MEAKRRSSPARYFTATLAVAAGAVLLWGARPADASSTYERQLADAVNELRAQYGRPGLPWSDAKAAEARRTARRCDRINGGDDPTGARFPRCHSNDYDGEVLFFIGGTCSRFPGYIRQAVFGAGGDQGWKQTPPDLAYLRDGGLWPDATSIGVHVTCDKTTAYGRGLYFVVRLGH